MALKLSKSQIEQYHEEGFVAIEGAVPEKALAELQRVTNDLLAKAEGMTESDGCYDIDPASTPEKTLVRRLKRPFDNWPYFDELIRKPFILDPVEQLIGPDIRVNIGKVNFKTPGHGFAIEWHQDWAFFPYTNDNGLAAGIYLDEATYENGAMLMLPGTHKMDAFDHHANGYFCGAMDSTTSGLNFDDYTVVGGPPGTLTLHHVRTVHGSAENHSDRARSLFIAGYFAADAWPLHARHMPGFEQFQRYMVRGEHREPRLDANVPIRMPYPSAPNQGSIYENQESVANRYFESFEETRARAAGE